ncbi:hypothetical protein K505DRAFT_256436 [Melanomma pulvis-pyrius CBS 109.77]|uniref:RBR-type E3 ubiquitin transferase n=1 Tax=Melanomma pulvis-pyrius CBS 109.77 TaxID=1314802 RepID=A0A6A6WUY0_9PLEO|nr:hypothetical protein K505DRAFT_256436 [Melanomma pulvis-pyrius CBS 109.77]
MRLSRQRQTCQVCKESRHIAHFSTWAPTTRCVHPSQTCVSCMQKWIATCMETKGWNTCICPECGEPLAYDDVKLFATQEVFARYDHLSTRAALSSLPNFHWCQSPTCSSGHIYDESTLNNPIFTCASCGHAHCLNHPSVPYHAGETCSQYDARITPPTPAASSSQKVLEEKANVKCVQETSKRCPNAICGWFIEKNEGCDMMTCWKCRFEFCWECSAPFGPISRKGNKFHKEGCKYWG